MESFTPSKKTAQDFNGGAKYVDGTGDQTGDALQAESINNVIEATLYAQEQAVNAVATANSAKTSSDNAVSAADNARENADNAVIISSEAKGMASSAMSVATTAKTTAELANNTANTAIEQSSEADTKVKGAVATANSANKNAASAVETANEALSKIDKAISGSVASVNGQTGAVTVTPSTIGAVNKSGDTMTGNLTVPLIISTDGFNIGNRDDLTIVPNDSSSYEMRFTELGNAYHFWAKGGSGDYVKKLALVLNDGNASISVPASTGEMTLNNSAYLITGLNSNDYTVVGGDFNNEYLLSHGYMGSIQVSESPGWYNLINIRHRNGTGDGTNYGLQIRKAMTVGGCPIEYRQQIGGEWGNWQRFYGTENKPAADEIGAIPVTGGTATGTIGAPAFGQSDTGKDYVDFIAGNGANFGIGGENAQIYYLSSMRDDPQVFKYYERNSNGRVDCQFKNGLIIQTMTYWFNPAQSGSQQVTFPTGFFKFTKTPIVAVTPVPTNAANPFIGGGVTALNENGLTYSWFGNSNQDTLRGLYIIAIGY